MSVPEVYHVPRRSLPAWAISVVAHAVLLVLLAVLFGTVSRGLSDEPDRRAGIVLAEGQQDEQVAYYEDEQEESQEAESATSTPVAPATQLPERSIADQLQIPEIDLPGLEPVTAPGSELAIPEPKLPSNEPRAIVPNPGDAKRLAEEAARRRQANQRGPQASVSLFGGSNSVGRSFVFVIDRSKSMGSEGLGALSAAQRELAAALERLEPSHTFQIVAYHHDRVFMGEGGLVPANAANKSSVVSFFSGLAAFGGTNHEMALSTALRLQPEVIYLLTDGGDPYLTVGQMIAIRRRAQKTTTIHCVQFGFGPLQDSDPFMARLARQNGGGFRYVDMSKAPARAP